MDLKPQSKIAIVCADGIGDALIYMNLAHNFQINQHTVTLYNKALLPLQLWFPTVKIANPAEEYDWQRYDYIFSQDHSPTHQLNNHINIGKRLFDRRQSIIDNLTEICRNKFKLSKISSSSGLQPLTEQQCHRKHLNRIIIHPFSKAQEKNWPLNKYIDLAYQLKAMSFNPIFIMSPDEKKQYQGLIPSNIETPSFDNLSDLAHYIYQSGFMIGNDSGIGHLASALGLPSLSLFRVKSKAMLWRPGYGKNNFITPLIRIPGSKFRHYWKHFLTVNKVKSEFIKLTKEHEDVISSGHHSGP